MTNPKKLLWTFLTEVSQKNQKKEGDKFRKTDLLFREGLNYSKNIYKEVTAKKFWHGIFHDGKENEMLDGKFVYYGAPNKTLLGY